MCVRARGACACLLTFAQRGVFFVFVFAPFFYTLLHVCMCVYACVVMCLHRKLDEIASQLQRELSIVPASCTLSR